jgi:hypothetical protein
MKRVFVALLLLVFIASGCSVKPTPTITSPAVTPSPQPNTTAQGANSVAPTASALPSTTASPTATSASQNTTESKADPTTQIDQSVAVKAMQRDIDLLKAQNQDQLGQEENYKNLKKEQWITVESVTTKELKFVGKPQVFKGDYTGQFTANKKYRYFADASMGGKRYYNVKDNFGVWVTFKYVEPF